MLIEELTQIPDEKRYLQLISSCRSTIPGLKPMVFSTSNPGGIGHEWVKKRFVDPAPPSTQFKDKTSGRTRIFIPATIDDNPLLKKIDPGYIRMLDALKDTDEDLWKAWRHGSWEVFAGQFFKSFRRDLHVIPNHIVDGAGFVIGSLDWGRVDNFSFHLHHVFPAYFNGMMFYRVVTFLEVYGNERNPVDWAEEIRLRMSGTSLALKDLGSIQADNQIFSKTPADEGKTIAHWFYEYDQDYNGLLVSASKNRVAGWEACNNWLSMAPDGKPYWQVTENCINLIRLIPTAVHNENKRNDIDDSGEDDALDDWRYGLISLKWINAKVEAVVRGEGTITKSTVEQDFK